MRKYTSKSDKIKMYSEKYNMSEDEIYRILTEHEALLTFDELKIRYDCPTLGKIPEWITEDELDLMIWNCVHKIFDERYSSWTTREDLHGELQVFIRERFHLYNSHGHIKVAIINRLKSMLDERIWRSKHFTRSLDDVVTSSNEDDGINFGYFIEDPKANDNDKLIIKDIMSIKNESVRDLLIVTGYLVSNISCLEDLYNEVLNRCSDDVKDKLVELNKRIEYNDNLAEMKSQGLVATTTKTKSLKIQDIISAMNFNLNLKGTYKESKTKRYGYKVSACTPNESLSELQYYLTATNFI